MAHEVETMAWTNQVPWHGLGFEVKGDLSIEGWLKVAGLDWELERKPLLVEAGKGLYTKVPGRYAMVRTSDNKIMTVTGKDWKPLQPKAVLTFMKDYVSAGGASLETAGSLRGGQIIWGLAKLKHSFSVGRGDTVNGYLLITSPNTVGRAITVRTTTVRVVCANTLALAEMGGTVNYRQNHLTEFDVAAAKEKVAEAHEQLAVAEQRAKTIAKLKLSLEDSVKKVLVPVFMPELMEDDELMAQVMDPDVMPTKIAGMVQAMEHAPGAIDGTGWGTLNGVTYWTDHMQGHSAATRMFRAWIGDYSRRKLEVEDKLLELAG